jgi:hypothetical protein
VVVTAGLTVIELVELPVLQTNVLPATPDAVSVTLPPAQIVGGVEIEAVAAASTVTLLLALAVQLVPLETVTEYVVLEAGLTVMSCVVAPLLQMYDTPAGNRQRNA